MQILLGLVMLGVASIAYSQTTQRPFTITVSTAKPEVKSGDAVYVDVVMTNTSDHDIDCTRNWSNALDRNYLYEVIDEFGQPLPQIVRNHPAPFRLSPCVIKPGETAKSGGLISILYDFSRPGKYTIQVSRGVSPDPDNLVKSNVITITVLPTDEPAPTKQQ
jgi:hypothetical protein